MRDRKAKERLAIRDGELHYSLRGEASLRLDDVVVIGEYTNESGPFADDWWLVFLTNYDTQVECSMYAEGVNDGVAQLQRRFVGMLHSGFAHSTTFNSRVLWPPALQHEPLLTFSRNGGQPTFVDRLLELVTGGAPLHVQTSDAVKRFLHETTIRPRVDSDTQRTEGSS